MDVNGSFSNNSEWIGLVAMFLLASLKGLQQNMSTHPQIELLILGSGLELFYSIIHLFSAASEHNQMMKYVVWQFPPTAVRGDDELLVAHCTFQD